jgi:hypothetical protein
LTHVVECLLSKHKALSSNCSSAKKTKQTKSMMSKIQFE